MKSFQAVPFYKIPELILCMITDLLFNSRSAHLCPFKVTMEGASKLRLSLAGNEEDARSSKLGKQLLLFSQ